MSNTWQSVETALFPIVSSINQYLSNYILVFLLLSVGIWYSIKTRFIQIRCFGEGMKKVFGNLSLNGKKHEQGMSSFQALATAIAAQVGTGNIVGASRSYLDRRSWSHLLDVAHRFLWHGNHLRGGSSGC